MQMKTLIAARSFAIIASVAALATAGADNVAFSLGFDDDLVVPCQSASWAVPDSLQRHPGKWSVNNDCKRITISAKEVDGEKCTELKLNRKDCDTAFSFHSDRFSVRGGSGFRLTVRVRGTYSLEDAQGQWGRGGTYVGWYDMDGNRLATEFHFGLPFDDKGWQDVSVEGHVPDDAVEAFVVIGKDSPNFKENERLCLSKATFVHVDAASVPRKVVVRPKPLTAELAPGVKPVTKGLATLRDDGMT